jgi:hypothetical protein
MGQGNCAGIWRKVEQTGKGVLKAPDCPAAEFPANIGTGGFSMKLISAAGVLLALLLAGCAQTGSDNYGKPSASSNMQYSQLMAYHNSNFGDPNNQPFGGSYPDR